MWPVVEERGEETYKSRLTALVRQIVRQTCIESVRTHWTGTLIFSLSLDHHLYADDTQLFFSFHPLNFDSSISHLQDALQHISSWMTANFLTLNSSKTEF